MTQTAPDFGLYNMKLGDPVDVRPNKVTRVPGGWLWHMTLENAVFVPFNSEFQPSGIPDDLPF